MGRLERDIAVVLGGGGSLCGLGRGRAVGRGGAFGLLQELDATARSQADLGGEPVGLLAVLAPAPRLQDAGDVDEPSRRGVLLELVLYYLSYREAIT